MAISIQSVPGPASRARICKPFWERLLLGALLGTGGIGYYVFLHSKNCPSTWMLASYIAGSAGLTLVNLAIEDMSRSAREYSEDLLSQKLPESESATDEFSEDESVAGTTEYYFNFKRPFIKFIELHYDMNTKSVRKIFNTKCSECVNAERNGTSSETFEFVESLASSVSESDYQKLTNSHATIHFPNKLKEVTSSRFYYWYHGNVTRGAGLLQNKVIRVLSEFDKLLEHSINPQTLGGDPIVLYMKKKKQDEYILPSNLNWESCIIVDLMKGIINQLQYKLKSESIQLEATIINKWENRMENIRYLTLNSAFGILTSAEVTYVQEIGTQTDFVYHCQEESGSTERTKCALQ